MVHVFLFLERSHGSKMLKDAQRLVVTVMAVMAVMAFV